MMSPTLVPFVSRPSSTRHPLGTVGDLYPRQPLSVLPSNSRRQPAACSAGVSVLSDAVELEAPAERGGVPLGAAPVPTLAQATPPTASRTRTDRAPDENRLIRIGVWGG